MQPIKRSHKLLMALVLSAISGVCALCFLARDSYPRIETLALQTPIPIRVAWSPDSRRWIFQRASDSDVCLMEFYRDGEQKTPTHALPETIENPHILGFAHNGAVIVGDFGWDFNTPAAKQVRICQYPYGATQQIREGKIVFPCVGKIWNVALDCRGERLLWHLRVDPKDSRPTWLRETMNLLHVSSKSDVIDLFWVCKVDGSDGKVIGFLDAGKDTDSIPSRCRWLPSGTKFSFVSGKTLWVVPVTK